MGNLPQFLEKYFWDVDFEKVDLKKYPKDIIGRILQYGNEEAVRWLRAHFSRDEIADVLIHYRFVSPKSANFWSLIYDIPKDQILCLQKHYLETQRSHWPY